MKKKGESKSASFMRISSCVGSLFIDSGAHGLYNRHAKGKGADGYNLTPNQLVKRYAFYKSKDFYKYVDEYCDFIKKGGNGVDFYVNVDAIFHPQYSYDALKYIEEKHGLNPIPVLHYNTPLKWFEKHLEEGYKFLGIGGLGQDATTNDYIRWADDVFRLLCPASNNHNPIVKTHGFAMTSWRLLFRYPWWSVDSASWLKAGAYGMIYVPRKRNGEFSFLAKPYSISISSRSPDIQKGGKHFDKLHRMERAVIEEWLAYINVPMGESAEDGSIITPGVYSDWAERCRANLLYFEELRKHLPDWPWPFTQVKRQPLFTL